MRITRRSAVGDPRQFLPEPFESESGGGADRDKRRGCGIEKRIAQKLFHFEAYDFERVGIDEIGFGQDCQAATDV